MFNNKVLLITGGTGSFGNAVLRRFLESDIKEIRIFSRDEKKQDDMRKAFNSDKLKFYIGDVRDPQSISTAMRGVDYVFHAAALKQVPSCEFYPLEAVKTNVLGTENVLESAIFHGVSRVVCLSTDKAVSDFTLPPAQRKLTSKKVKIGNNTWIGESVMILPGVIIGEGCIIGAGSIVTKNIPEYIIAVGNPACVIKSYGFNKCIG